MNEKPPKITAIFCIESNEFDPNTFERIIGIKSTKKGYKGEKWPNSNMEIPITFWSYEVQGNSWGINEIIEELLENIWDKKELIKQFLLENNLESFVLCNVDTSIDESHPEYEFDQNNIQKIAFLNSGIRMDII